MLLFGFLIVFMAGWSYMLCYFDHECRPFGGAFVGGEEKSNNVTKNNATAAD